MCPSQFSIYGVHEATNLGMYMGPGACLSRGQVDSQEDGDTQEDVSMCQK